MAMSVDSLKGKKTKNNAGGDAVHLGARGALAQLAVTGCFNNTFYVTAEKQLDEVLDLAKQCDPEFVAKVAVYARQSGFMKDIPASLVAYLSAADVKIAAKAFPKVIDNGKMLRNFVQIVRSGVFGRRNLSAPSIQRMVHGWFDSRTEEDLFRQSIGSNPSMGDVIRMSRPVPKDPARSAMFAWLLGKDTSKFNGQDFKVADNLSEKVRAYEAFKANPVGDVPDMPFEMATGLPLTADGWKQVARRASWTQTFKSLNTFSRHGVFEDKALVKLVVERLQNPDLIRKSKAFPYQILMAYKAAVEGFRGAFNKEETLTMPAEIGRALEAAMEIAVANVPTLEGSVVVCPDVSGSMSSGITGTRINPKTKRAESHSSQVRCIDVAGLIASAMLRANKDARVIPFEGDVVKVKLSASDTIMTNAQKLASIGGGATNCAAPLALLNREKAKVDYVLFVSDNESWSNGYSRYNRQGATSMSSEWDQLKARNSQAKLICLDISANTTSQVESKTDVLNIGGFSDTVFEVISSFVKGGEKDAFVKKIEAIEL